MSLTALHDAFVARTITRGAFIRRLVGFGMALPIATHYATALQEVAAAPNENPHAHFCERHPEWCEEHCPDHQHSPLCGANSSGV